MPFPPLNTIDDYERALAETLERWSPRQRAAFAAAMAERWLHVYEAFSAEEEWGDAPALRHALDAVWAHLRGTELADAERRRRLQQVQDSTPHMDDFDAHEALAAAGLVSDALESCAPRQTIAPATQAALSGFEAALPDWEDALQEQPRLWQRGAVRRELEKQVQVLQLVEALGPDAAAIDDLRRRAAEKALRGEKSRAKAPQTAKGQTNQALFEQYRRMMELDIRTAPPHMDLGDPTAEQLLLVGNWAGRYSRRKQTIDGSYGAPADLIGQQALRARNRAVDERTTGAAPWDADARERLSWIYSNPTLNLGASAPEDPHPFGPSVRRLLIEARTRGTSPREAWLSLRTWAYHRPAAWAEEDRRRKAGLAYHPPGFGASLERTIDWRRSEDPVCPWTSEVDGKVWTIRLNDFPDEIMYSLLIDGDRAGDFHDWPAAWHRLE